MNLLEILVELDDLGTREDVRRLVVGLAFSNGAYADVVLWILYVNDTA